MQMDMQLFILDITQQSRIIFASASNYISLYLWDAWDNYYSYLSVR